MGNVKNNTVLAATDFHDVAGFAIEHAIEIIDRNVYLNLILLQLLFELKKLLRRKKHV